MRLRWQALLSPNWSWWFNPVTHKSPSLLRTNVVAVPQDTIDLGGVLAIPKPIGGYSVMQYGAVLTGKFFDAVDRDHALLL